MSESTYSKIHLVYPHQLFEEVFSLPKDFCIFLIEDPLFFLDKEYPRRFHKQKLVLHRASMKAFEDKLKNKGFKVKYFSFLEYPEPKVISGFALAHKTHTVSFFNPTDYILEKRLKKAFLEKEFKLDIQESPNFLTSKSQISDFFGDKKRFLMNSFYIFQRKRLDILLDAKKEPVGGKWSFDAENRKKLPKNIVIPKSPLFRHDDFVKEAIDYVNKHFPENPGVAENFNYPITHQEAKRLLKEFLEIRFPLFGLYEDAISRNETLIFHSMLSAPLNIGLLSPEFVVKSALAYQDKVSLASLEGFIRQIIGWREFMRAVYEIKGSEIRNSNSLRAHVKLAPSWYSASTGIEPIDDTINKILNSAYCHHIERLMLLGNFMLLLQINPHDVYAWFMDMFIDAYDWVMVPNVYSMSQFADGGTITTKPYFSSSNYVLKMSDYKKAPWCDVWDALFYNFLEVHRKLIEKNIRLKVLLKHLDKMTPEKKAGMKKLIKEKAYL